MAPAAHARSLSAPGRQGNIQLEQTGPRSRHLGLLSSGHVDTDLKRSPARPTYTTAATTPLPAQHNSDTSSGLHSRSSVHQDGVAPFASSSPRPPLRFPPHSPHHTTPPRNLISPNLQPLPAPPVAHLSTLARGGLLRSLPAGPPASLFPPVLFFAPGAPIPRKQSLGAALHNFHPTVLQSGGLPRIAAHPLHVLTPISCIPPERIVTHIPLHLVVETAECLSPVAGGSAVPPGPSPHSPSSTWSKLNCQPTAVLPAPPPWGLEVR